MPWLWFHLTPLSALEPPAQRIDTPNENYDDAEEIAVPEARPDSRMSEGGAPPEEETGMRASQTGEWD